MRKGLFRQEAVSAQNSKTQGRLLMTPKPAFMLLTTAIFIWVVAVIVYMNTTSFSRKASVLGWLEPATGVFKLYPDMRRGTVTRVLAKEGDAVKAGTPLLEITYSKQSETGERASSMLLKELTAKQQRLHNTIARLEALHIANTIAKNETLAALQQSFEAQSNITALAQKQWSLAKVSLEKAEILQRKGHISASEFDNQTLQYLSAEQQFKLAQQDKRKEFIAINTLQREIERLPQQHANELANFKNALSDVTQQIVLHNEQTKETVYAPKAGIVSGMNLQPGHIVDGSNLLLTLLPQDNDIQARILVPVRSAGFVDVGQALHIRYDAFPYQKFGVQQGLVKSVSHTVLIPGDLNNAPIPINEPTYLVTASINSQEILAYGKAVGLRAGMTFSADVELSNRTLMEWLLEPLYSVIGKL
jgi:membrane fusion protein